MQKEKILSDLYHGNIRPADKEIIIGSEYQKRQIHLMELVEKLDNKLSENEKKQLDETMTVWGNLNSLTSEEYFKDGFCLGAKIILEIFEKDNEQLKPITG